MTTLVYIWLGESREWMSVTGAVEVESCSRKMGWRGEEGKERLQERMEEGVGMEEWEVKVEWEVEGERGEEEGVAGLFPLQRER